MKASGNNSQQKPTFSPKPLTPEQLNAIDLLIQGKTDQQVADAVSRDRVTIWEWRTRHPLFIATMEQQRAAQFGGAASRLRALLDKAIDNIATAIEAGNVRSSFELVRACGLHGFVSPVGETDPQKVALTLCLQQLAREQIPEQSFDLIDVGKNPAYQQRQREILEELGRGDEIA